MSEHQNKMEEQMKEEGKKDETKDSRKEMLERLQKSKEQFAKAQKYNRVAVENEAKRLYSKSYVNREKSMDWKEEKETEVKEMKMRGITEKNAHLLKSAESAEKEKEVKKEKEKNRINNFGWNIFSEDALYRGYEKRLKELPTDPKKIEGDIEEDPLDYGIHTELKEEDINRVAEFQKKQDEKHKNFSKRKTYYQQEDVDYINERNRFYNKKLARYFDKYTGDIRANLERGTAL